MKDPKITAAYDRCQPSNEVKERILAQVTARRSAKKPLRWLLPAAVCAALLAVLTTTGFALYEKWHLPEPETYEPGNHGVREVHETLVYDGDEVFASTAPAETTAGTALTDADFLRMAAELLKTVGLTDVSTETMTVAHQTALNYGREEIEICFSNDAYRTSVRYHAQTGALLSFSSIDFDAQNVNAEASEAEAAELAERYYALLPVTQGYVLTGCEKYDEQYWSYEFCRMVEPDVYNPYEMVRIAVNPLSGRLTGCNVFCFPLLDDHEPDDPQISQEDAERIARESGKLDLQRAQLISAEVEIVLPNWMFTGYDTANACYSEVSRYAWVLVYRSDNGEFETETKLYIDLYTGELLGGDTTG